ncbi:unnamed protein product [Miscanthus lutarioriparius]|uniref:NAC domain-containing protein n=1 Tax=Miscanthus lutarioriparius TaxID=422564 RepID=A0A811NN19_9POAL|nr:unnamed protein product [Miscanthus lutarioriparius]
MAEQQQPEQQEMNAVGASRGLSLPPGFRFHPSDNEIVSMHLPKEQGEAKLGEKEWYFYQKDRKYPTGLRANRTTKGGVVLLVGMKKTLVFYKGRAPRGDKTNWVMHEYRLEGSGKLPDPASASSSAPNVAAMKCSVSASKDEWVVCRVFDKTTRIKKMTTPAYKVSMAGAEIGQNQNNIPAIPIPMPLQLPLPVPMPMQSPILPDFATDPVPPYFPNTGTGMPPMMSSMAGIGGTSGL